MDEALRVYKSGWRTAGPTFSYQPVNSSTTTLVVIMLLTSFLISIAKMLYHSVPYLVGLASIAQRTNGYFLPVTENNIDEIRKRQNPDYDATRAVAQISWFDTPDCQPELGRQIYRFDVPGLDQAPVNPDQCDPGLPE